MVRAKDILPQMTATAQRQEMPPRNSMELAEYLARNCTACALSQTRTNVVPGEGPTDARVMLIGEAPGKNEDKEGRPFVGAAGKLLDELLPEAELDRSEVYITNILKCRPPGNRDPLPEEIATCRRHLEIQICRLNPELIITLGAFSLHHFFPRETIGKVGGILRNLDGRFIYPVMHPAAALRRREFRDRVTEQFRRIPAARHTLRTAPPPPEPKPAPAPPRPEQSALL